MLDFVEAWNARLFIGNGNVQRRRVRGSPRLPGVAVSDAHTVLEVGVAYTVLEGPIDDAAGLRAALPGARLVTAKGSRAVRVAMPVAKLIQRLRGNRRDCARMTDQTTPQPADEELVDYPLVREEAEQPQPLSRRLRDPRTIISIVLPIVLLVLIAFNLRGLDLSAWSATILAANPLLLVAAFAIFYLGFPLRGFRWQWLLRSAGTRIGLRDSTEIIFISWLVNCLVPAKLGDVYRAWLLRANFTVSLSRTFGTVFIERIFDLFAIAILGLAAGFWSFRGNLPTEVQIVFAIGVIFVLGLSIGLFTLRNFGRRALVRLPLPAKEKLLEFYERFEEGVFAINPRQVPALARPHRADLGDRGDAPAVRDRGAQLPRRPPRHQRRVLRGAVGVAADGHPVHAGRAGHRRGRRGRHPDRHLRHQPDGCHGDHARRPGDQRAVDHHPRQHRLRAVEQDQGRAAHGGRATARTRLLALARETAMPVPLDRHSR